MEGQTLQIVEAVSDTLNIKFPAVIVFGQQRNFDPPSLKKKDPSLPSAAPSAGLLFVGPQASRESLSETFFFPPHCIAIMSESFTYDDVSLSSFSGLRILFNSPVFVISLPPSRLWTLRSITRRLYQRSMAG